MTQNNPNLVRGSLDLLILKSLSWEPRHGYGISEWIESATDGGLLMEEGTLYPALHRLRGKGLVESEWGVSENNRKARYYRLTTRGRARLAAEADAWHRHASAVARALAIDGPNSRA